MGTWKLVLSPIVILLLGLVVLYLKALATGAQLSSSVFGTPAIWTLLLVAMLEVSGLCFIIARKKCDGMLLPPVMLLVCLGMAEIARLRPELMVAQLKWLCLALPASMLVVYGWPKFKQLLDYQYVLGALLPSGGHHMADARFKRGPGRFDYSPIMPQYMLTMNAEHEIVTEPIVVLCNCKSLSMAEMTSMGAKVLENGTLIGTRTWGGFSALSASETYSNNYAGYVGIQNVTPVFCYIPQEVAFTLDNKILEGYGVTPDIEIPYDAATWNKGAGPDNQLDRALQFIRTGN
jgi:hypothetical protein